jgi:hypothetical protein
MQLSNKTRLFLILFGAGFLGVLSFLLVDLSAIVALIPVSSGIEKPVITPIIKVASLIQPTVLLALATFTGVSLAPKVGLSAPFAEAIASGSDASSTLKPQIIHGLIGGFIGAVAIVSSSAVFKPFLSTEVFERIGRFSKVLGIPTRLLYGGVTEELLLRWGFMTLVVWLVWRIFQKRQTTPTRGSFIAAILFSALVFALGHLPLAFILFRDAIVTVALFVILANSAFGLVASYLYWKRGLESAIIAHMFGHVLLVTASYVGAYF